MANNIYSNIVCKCLIENRINQDNGVVELVDRSTDIFLTADLEFEDGNFEIRSDHTLWKEIMVYDLENSRYIPTGRWVFYPYSGNIAFYDNDSSFTAKFKDGYTDGCVDYSA